MMAKLIAVRAISLEPEPISAFELQRRAGDSEATRIQAYLDVLPRLVALQRLIEGILMVALVIVCISLGDWFVGGIVAVVLIIASDIFAHRLWVKRQVNHQYRRYESRLLDLITSWRWLDIVSTIDLTAKDVVVASKPELLDLVSRSGDILSRDEQSRLKGSLSFNTTLVSDVMTPRSVIESIDMRESIGPLVLDQLHKTGHSRFPVVDGDIDHVVGTLYLHDLVTLSSSHKTAKGAMQPHVYYIREDHDIEHALHAFLRTHHHLFIVVNEFRETVGVLSLEDVIEALLGHQVIDEFDEYHDLRKVAESNPHRSNEPKGKINV